MDSRHKNALIGALLAVVFVMAVGYAAFAQQLTINGTANINSNWDVHIKSIVAGTPTGGAQNVSANADGSSTASFTTNLTAPGDSITYTVTVENSGDLNAKLENYTTNFGENNATDAIVYTVNGLDKDSILPAGDETTFTVTVSYNNAVTTQPGGLSKTGTITLDYVQS